MTKEEFDSIPTLKEFLMSIGLSEEESEYLEKSIVKEYSEEIAKSLENIKPIDNKFNVEYLESEKENQ